MSLLAKRLIVPRVVSSVTRTFSVLPGDGVPPAEEIEALVARSRKAQAQIAHYTQEQVDDLISAMVYSVCQDGVAEEIAQHTVDESRLGNYDGKYLKIHRKTRATLMDIIVRRDSDAPSWQAASPLS